MGRRSKYEKFKPEVMRLFAEGLTPSEVLDSFDQRGESLSKSTVYDWHKEYRVAIIPTQSEQSANVDDSGKLIDRRAVARVTPDPETPLDRIIQAMWDVHDDPTADGAYTKLQALNALLKAEQYRNQVYAPIEKEDHEVTITVKREVVASEN